MSVARILAIDPGYTQSAWLELRDGAPAAFAIEPNAEVLHRIHRPDAEWLAVEIVASYGMPVGEEVFETVLWSGRFIQRWADDRGHSAAVLRLKRKDVKLHLCGTSTAKDANIRQALIDRFGPGKPAAVGLKASPGPLFGVSKDVWAALAVAVTAYDDLLGAGLAGVA